MQTMNQLLPWGILGSGNIAGKFASQLPQSRTGRLYAVASRSLASAEKFAAAHRAAKAYGSYQALLDDPAVQAVYISLPNHLHAEWTIRCAAAGKHILCEKPFTLNHAEAMTAIEAARAHGVFLMEAFMYRCHPVMADVTRRLRAGEIGQVKFIEVRFAYTGQPNPANVRWQNAAGGGAILDLGGYCLSMARLLAGAALGFNGPAEPTQLKAFGHIGEQQVDEWASATVRFPGDLLANLYASQRVGAENTAVVYGDQGRITLTNPWFPGRNGEPATYTLARDGSQPQVVTVPGDVPLYALEADVLAAHRQAGQAPAPCMTWADTLGNMEALDLWRQEIGLLFAPEKSVGPVHGPAPAARPSTGQRPITGAVPGLAKPVSRLVLGTMRHIFRDLSHTSAMADHFFARGGNCFDTAYIYGGGQAERLLGQWIRARGVRDEVVVMTKGATGPNCNPKAARDQFRISLDRLGLESVDIYLLHRDNPDIPVGEFVDALNELKEQGLMRAFGGSNWTIARLAEANRYAAAHGKTGFTASSPNFSLAVWNEDPWGQCITATDADSRAWYAQTQLPLFAWSSQASGILTGRFQPADRAKPELAEMVRVWFSEANFERLDRVRQLAAAKRVTAGQIALAYVLNQPLNIFPLIGPHTIDEMNESLDALPVVLTPAERQWLNLERPTI